MLKQESDKKRESRIPVTTRGLDRSNSLNSLKTSTESTAELDTPNKEESKKRSNSFTTLNPDSVEQSKLNNAIFRNRAVSLITSAKILTSSLDSEPKDKTLQDLESFNTNDQLSRSLLAVSRKELAGLREELAGLREELAGLGEEITKLRVENSTLAKENQTLTESLTSRTRPQHFYNSPFVTREQLEGNQSSGAETLDSLTFSNSPEPRSKGQTNTVTPRELTSELWTG